MANYFMNMYSVPPVLSASNVVPLATINHSDALALSIPTVANIGNSNSVRTITSTSQMVAHPSHTSVHPNPHPHMHMAGQSSGGSHRTSHNSSQHATQQHAAQQQHPQPAHSSQHQATTTATTTQPSGQRPPTANRTMAVACDTPYMCGVCNQGFRKPGSLKKHMRVHMTSNGLIDNATPQALKCTQCGCFRPITLTSLKPFRCEQCATSSTGAFEPVGMLRYQINKTGTPITAQQIHITPSGSSSSSPKGNIKIEMATILQQHGVFSDYFKKPSKHYKCTECDKSYRHQSTLAMHKKVHTGDVKYRCEHCGKEFYLTEYYQRHLRVHTKEKPYTCDICNKSFSQSNTLTQHKRTHTGEKPYECPMCGKQFAVRDYLNKHIRTHTGDKPFTCNICGKAYTQRSGLKTHSKSHYPEAHIQDDHVEEVQDEESIAEEDSSIDSNETLRQNSHPHAAHAHMNGPRHIPQHGHGQQVTLQQSHLDQSQMRLNPVSNAMLRS